jgi:hypothetical protein
MMTDFDKMRVKLERAIDQCQAEISASKEMFRKYGGCESLRYVAGWWEAHQKMSDRLVDILGEPYRAPRNEPQP